MAELEGGSCLAFASGMAAVAAVLGATLRPGNIVVLPTDGYYTVRMLADEYLTQMGVNVRMATMAGESGRDQVAGARQFSRSLSRRSTQSLYRVT